MQEVVIGQSYTVSANLGVNITGATKVVIKYIPPTESDAAEVVANVDNAITGTIHANITALVNTELGDWRVVGIAYMSSTIVHKTPGEIIRVLAEGVELDLEEELG